ncbi:MAG: Rnase Y domain-containing protein, partial [Candidatus Omnitrophota bacterium]|nr:Rnase Y domain-containing protein [Candidatus Omnitrophota bacterium]
MGKISYNDITVILFGFIIFGIGVGLFLLGYIIRKFIAERKVKRAEKIAGEILEEARKEAVSRRREAKLEVKDQLYKARIDFEQETKDRRRELLSLEKRV